MVTIPAPDKLAPVVGWDSGPIHGTAIMLRLHFVETEAEMNAYLHRPEQHHNFNAVLSPAQALELAAMLERHARFVLDQPTPPPSRQS